jgi:hypothetical protein
MRKLILLGTCLYALLTSVAAQNNDDPDLPSFANGIDKEAYLKAREGFYLSRIITLRELNYNPRTAAIEKMQQMEANQRTNTLSRIQTPSWIQLGPSPIPNGQTTTNSVAVSGRVTAIAIHPTNSNIIYIGTANGGVYRSMNAGTSWTAIFDGAQSLAIGALALAPSDPTILYVGTGEPQLSSDSYSGVGLYRINNADASPTLTGPINPNYTFAYTGGGNITTGTFTYRSISKILVHPTDPATIFVATTFGTASNGGTGYVPNTVGPMGLYGVYRSTNATAAAGSVAFTKLSVTDAGSFDIPGTGNRLITDMVMEPGNPNNLVCWVYDNVIASTTQGCGAYKSTNALAATPSFVKTYSSPAGSVRCEMDIAKVGAVITIYAGSGGATGNGQILKSIDGGTTFAPVAGSFTFCSGQCFYDIAVAVNPTDAQKVFIGGSSGTNIFRYSTNGGTSFTGSTDNLHADVHTLAVDPSNTNTIYLGCDGGIFKSTDAGVTWASSNTAGLHATQYQSIALHPIDPNFTIGGTQDNGTHMLKPDGSFTRIAGGDGGYTMIDQTATTNANAVLYHTFFNQTNAQAISRNDNGNAATELNWIDYGCGFGGVTANGLVCAGITNCLFYAPTALGPGTPNTVYFGSDRLWRSSNKAVAMVLASQAPITSGAAISSIAIAPTDDNYRIIGLSNGQVWATISGSSTLINITPAGGPAAPVGRVLISPGNSAVAFITYVGYFGSANPHVYKTINLNNLGGAGGVNGVTWAGSATNLPDVPVNCITMSAANLNNVFIGTDIGVFGSIDAGATWSSYSMNLPVVPVYDMAIHKVTNILRIATHGRGLWETATSPLPVTFTSFDASVFKKTNVLLQWFTATEINNKGFNIERATVNGSSLLKWEKIGFVNGSGTTSDPRRYEFTDVPVGGKKFVYRLKQIDYDGNYKYSEQRQVALNNFDFALFPVSPNPVRKNAIVKYQLPEDGTATMAVYNNAGALVRYLVNEKKEAGIYQAELNTNGLASGNYYIRLSIGSYYDTKPFIITNQ